MKYLIIFFQLSFSVSSIGQNRFNFNQYMLNQASFNPGYCDISTRFGGSLIAKKQWMTGFGTPFSFQANGFYNLTKNHGFSGFLMQDKIAQFNTFELSTSYTYHAWLTKTTALGIGLKAGFESRFTSNDYVYFEEFEPSLERTYKGAMQLGTGISIQGENLDLGFSIPHLFNNTLPNAKQTYGSEYITFYSHIGYKLRIQDALVLYPTLLARGVQGSKPGISLDVHALANQTFWFGGGYRSDNTLSLTAGIFLFEGVRVIYNYESSFGSPHKRLDNSHEVTLNFARSIADNPFSKMKYMRRGKSGHFRRRLR
jgi:type IX secretion system PorP/SprF family membrane protein